LTRKRGSDFVAVAVTTKATAHRGAQRSRVEAGATKEESEALAVAVAMNEGARLFIEARARVQ